MFSIDQNCHSLWDVLPKIQCLARRGIEVTHLIEDIDVAFTAVGADRNQNQLHLARERYYRSGGADWGAALFYSEFLGRLPTDIRQWEKYTGLKTKALASGLGRSVDDLFDEYSPSDNWQLIGPSYVGDQGHHRLIGDLSTDETAPHIWEVFDKAKADMFATFPDSASQKRLTEWFGRETAIVKDLLDASSSTGLAGLYRNWLGEYLGDSVKLDLTSNFFAIGSDPGRDALMEIFLGQYDLATKLYNESIAETGVELRPLNTDQGELPFFATMTHLGHKVRTHCYFQDGQLVIAGRGFPVTGGKLPIAKLQQAGIECLAGKAILLVIQLRLNQSGRALALPHNGSLYIPAAHALADKLIARKLLTGPLQPICRVKFNLLDRLAQTDTTIHLPGYLARAMGVCETPASTLGAAWRELSAEAETHLKKMTDPALRTAWQTEKFAKESKEIEILDSRRRTLAKTDTKSQEIRELSHKIRSMNRDILAGTLAKIADDWHLAQIDYWDSRGAIFPWSIALGGEGFYDCLLERAELIYEP